MSETIWLEDLGAAVEIAPGSIVSKPLQGDGRSKVVLFGFDAGQELSEHTASVPATIQVIEGEALFVLGGVEYEAKAGSFAYMPAQLPHAIRAKTPLKMLLVMLKGAERGE
jgi:quercetin dioxygenase-like cupin family protein